jgi:hypothetical protein
MFDRPWCHCGFSVQETEHVPDGAEFKDTIQFGQLKYLFYLVHDIHQP